MHAFNQLLPASSFESQFFLFSRVESLRSHAHKHEHISHTHVQSASVHLQECRGGRFMRRLSFLCICASAARRPCVPLVRCQIHCFSPGLKYPSAAQCAPRTRRREVRHEGEAEKLFRSLTRSLQ